MSLSQWGSQVRPCKAFEYAIKQGANLLSLPFRNKQKCWSIINPYVVVDDDDSVMH